MDNSRQKGFTLVELLVVLVIVALMASLAAPVVYTSVRRANEAALLETLQVTRKALDDFYADKQRYPDSLEELVEERYLRSLPHDPISKSSTSWQLTSADGSQGIADLHSGSDATAMDGSRYNEW